MLDPDGPLGPADPYPAVSFDHIEGGTISGMPGTAVVITGTNADNDITVVGKGTDDFTVSVDGGPAFLFLGVPNLTIDGLAGDDDIDVAADDGNPLTPALGLTSFNIIGGLPSADADTLTVTGVDGNANDNATWSPDEVDGGDLEIAGMTGGNAINVMGIERLIYDGMDANESLTIIGTIADDRFIHTPGAAADAGAVSITDIGNDDATLGIEYVNLGLQGHVFIDGDVDDEDGDVLVVRGTNGSDVIDVRFPDTDEIEVTLSSALGTHVIVQSIDNSVESYEIRSLEGDDDIHVAAPIDVTGTFSIFGDGPSGSDALFLTADDSDTETISIQPDASNPLDQDVIVQGSLIDVSGIELISLDGGNGADTLIVSPGNGDHSVRVDDQGLGDRSRYFRQSARDSFHVVGYADDRQWRRLWFD